MDVTRLAGLVLVVAASAGCAGGSDSTEPTMSVSDGSAPDDGDVFTEVESSQSGSTPGDVEPVVESIPPVPETGVPGLESDDEFCRAWSQYAGSLQALSFAWVVQAPESASVLEVAASDAVSDAVAEMSANLPTEIEANRQALTVDVPGPFLARAERARRALTDAGVSEDEIEALGDAWVEALTAAGIDDENITVDVSADLAAALDEAAAEFRGDVRSIEQDPTLDTTEFDIGPSLDYISENCPDRGTLAGNDVVEG